MNHKLSITKGMDLKIEGKAESTAVASVVKPTLAAIVPDDFPGFKPKTEVKEGDAVASGAPLMHDKDDDQIKLVSPVSGTVKEIVRGERRKIERIVIQPSDAAYSAPAQLPGDSPEEIKIFLKRTGLWAMMRQRPYDIVPLSKAAPRDIFVTAIDSAPLAIDPAEYLANKTADLEAGVAMLSKLTSGKVYIARRDGSSLPDIKGADMIDVSGPHPSGNVGTHIANIAPVNKGETVWTMDATTLWRIGVAASTGVAPATVFVTVAGSEVKTPQVVETVAGCDISSIVSGNLKQSDAHQRIISGNVLVGAKVGIDGFLRYPYRQVTVIPEGDDVDEFMGWASLSPKKMSRSRTFLSGIFGGTFKPDARLNGSKRAFIMSGEYERYMPMDIMAEYLLKAIIGRDIDQMEKLGIYEVAPEDFALGEYADTSKIEAQKIVREGLDYLRKELE